MATLESRGILTKGATLSYKLDEEFVVLEDLQSIPTLGGEVDNVETTTLKHGARTYIPGLKDYGDLEFGFLYGSEAGSSFKVLQALQLAGDAVDFMVSLPDSTTVEFPAGVSVRIEPIEVGEAMTFTAVLSLGGEMVFAQNNTIQTGAHRDGMCFLPIGIIYKYKERIK